MKTYPDDYIWEVWGSGGVSYPSRLDHAVELDPNEDTHIRITPKLLQQILKGAENDTASCR